MLTRNLRDLLLLIAFFHALLPHANAARTVRFSYIGGTHATNNAAVNSQCNVLIESITPTAQTVDMKWSMFPFRNRSRALTVSEDPQPGCPDATLVSNTVVDGTRVLHHKVTLSGNCRMAWFRANIAGSFNDGIATCSGEISIAEDAGAVTAHSHIYNYIGEIFMTIPHPVLGGRAF